MLTPSVVLPSTRIPSAQSGAAIPYSMGGPRYGVSGLGQACDPATQSAIDQGLIPASACPGYSTGGGGSSGGGGGGGGTPWYAPVLQSAIQGISAVVKQQTNPFAPKNLPAGTSYSQTPYGTTVLTAGSTPIGAPLTAANLSSMMPLLLIGGGLLLVMMMARR